MTDATDFPTETVMTTEHTGSIRILPATAADAAELLAIYAPYVTDTAVSFEYDVPTVEEFADRIRKFSARYPYLKAVEAGGRILGYAYAHAFIERRAYDWSVETTIYLDREQRHRGLGTLLYRELERRLKAMGVLNMNACIAVYKEGDPYLTDDSPRFHEHYGFTEVGIFHDSGYKFGRWYDMVWMEKMIGAHTAEPKAIRGEKEHGNCGNL